MRHTADVNDIHCTHLCDLVVNQNLCGFDVLDFRIFKVWTFFFNYQTPCGNLEHNSLHLGLHLKEYTKDH